MRRRAVLALMAAVEVRGADVVVFEGRPQVRVDSDGKETKLTELSTSAGEKFACRIVRKGRGYAWASRENRRLDRVQAGDVTYYVSPEGSGYVKVLEVRQRAAEGFDYLEQVSTGLKTITYWGRAGKGGEAGEDRPAALGRPKEGTSPAREG
jgi:hypothetical protein